MRTPGLFVALLGREGPGRVPATEPFSPEFPVRVLVSVPTSGPRTLNLTDITDSSVLRPLTKESWKYFYMWRGNTQQNERRKDPGTINSRTIHKVSDHRRVPPSTFSLGLSSPPCSGRTGPSVWESTLLRPSPIPSHFLIKDHGVLPVFLTRSLVLTGVFGPRTDPRSPSRPRL